MNSDDRRSAVDEEDHQGGTPAPAGAAAANNSSNDFPTGNNVNGAKIANKEDDETLSNDIANDIATAAEIATGATDGTPRNSDSDTNQQRPHSAAPGSTSHSNSDLSSSSKPSQLSSSPRASSHRTSSQKNKYDHYDEEELREFAKLVSPTVSELLSEEALDDLLGEMAWISDSDSDSNSDNYSDSESDADYEALHVYEHSGGEDAAASQPDTDHDKGMNEGGESAASQHLSRTNNKHKNKHNNKHAKIKKNQKNKSKRHKKRANKRGDDSSEEDDINEELNRLEKAQLNLRDELEFATNALSAFFDDGKLLSEDMGLPTDPQIEPMAEPPGIRVSSVATPNYWQSSGVKVGSVATPNYWNQGNLHPQEIAGDSFTHPEHANNNHNASHPSHQSGSSQPKSHSDYPSSQKLLQQQRMQQHQQRYVVPVYQIQNHESVDATSRNKARNHLQRHTNLQSNSLEISKSNKHNLGSNNVTILSNSKPISENSYPPNQMHNTISSQKSQKYPNNYTHSPKTIRKFKLSYTLSDHALALDVSRHASDKGMYTRPLFSQHELETMGIVTLPQWIVRPGEVPEESEASITSSIPPKPPHTATTLHPTSPYLPHPSHSNHSSPERVENTSRGRENYMKRTLSCTLEYIEPPKPKTLRKLYAGWNPSPGERRDDERAAAADAAPTDDHVTPYPEKDDDSSHEEEVTNFEDVEGISYSTPYMRRFEPRPVRTVSVRIRPDVLCGAVMDALMMAVERLRGEMTKRQGGHLRAVIPGRKMRVWLPGEKEMMRQKEDCNGTSQGASHGSEHDEDDAQSHQSQLTHDDYDSSSVASGLSSLLSFTSPIKRHRSKRKGPTFTLLPPFLIDAQLCTKKIGKDCPRVLLIRTYRVQDVVYSGAGEEGQEILDVSAPMESMTDVGVSQIDLEAESRGSLNALQEASSLVQRIKSVGGEGFAIDPLPHMPGSVDTKFNDPNVVLDGASTEGETPSISSDSKSYLRSFGDALVSPIRYFGSSAISSSSLSLKSPHGALPPPPSVMELMSTELKKYQSSPSVGTRSKTTFVAARKKSFGVFPSLSKEDAPFVKASWLFLRECVEELDRRCLSYSTLGISPLFQFPALPTLDAHFLSQIKSFCRESMIVSLVKTASELEIYAREFEVSCNNLDQLLRPTFEMYKLDKPALPTPIPLTAYPLDFQPPEETCPPWGAQVMNALEQISNDINESIGYSASACDNNQPDNLNLDKINSPNISPSKLQKTSSLERAEEAVALIILAFQRQNDVEQGARLGRKNMQVMDRLAKMQAHKRNSIGKIRDSYGSNLLATKAADEFHSLLLKSSQFESLPKDYNAVSDKVPLLICSVMVGNATGTCFVTQSLILFVTQLVPILGGNRIDLFSIMDVQLTIQPPSKTMLSGLPASISLTTAADDGKTIREEVYNFVPSIGARRFAKFLEVVKDVAVEDPETLKFSERGGLIYMYEDS